MNTSAILSPEECKALQDLVYRTTNGQKPNLASAEVVVEVLNEIKENFRKGVAQFKSDRVNSCPVSKPLLSQYIADTTLINKFLSLLEEGIQKNNNEVDQMINELENLLK